VILTADHGSTHIIGEAKEHTQIKWLDGHFRLKLNVHVEGLVHPDVELVQRNRVHPKRLGRLIQNHAEAISTDVVILQLGQCVRLDLNVLQHHFAQHGLL